MMVHRNMHMGMMLLVEGRAEILKHHERLFPRIEWGPPVFGRFLFLPRFCNVRQTTLQGRPTCPEVSAEGSSEEDAWLVRGFSPVLSLDNLMEYALCAILRTGSPLASGGDRRFFPSAPAGILLAFPPR